MVTSDNVKGPQLSPSQDKPLVAITRTSNEGIERYVDAIERAGGEPHPILFESRAPVRVEEILPRLGALVLSSGEEVHPRWYGESVDSDADVCTNLARDEIEMPLLEAALDRNIPVLGICRGMHVINVAMGGKLMRRVPGHDVVLEDGERVSSFHRVYISPGSKLAAVVGSGGFVRLNSRHRQGVREPQKSPRLLAAAYSLDDGVIEGLESPSHRWVIGVQFHPERRMEVPPHFDRLFQSLVERAAEYRADPSLRSG